MRVPRRRAALFVAFLTLVLIAGSLSVTSCQATGGSSRGKLAIFLIDVGQGDGMLIQTPGGKNIVVDAGVEATTVTKFLQARKVKQVDYFIVTHPHADHVGGATYLLEHIPVKAVYDSGKEHTTSLYESFLTKTLELVKAGKTTYTKARAGQNLQVEDGLTLNFLHPTDEPAPPPDDINNSSIVFKLTYKAFAMLFTGDAETWAEEQMLARHADLKAQVLKVGHHGSKSSTTEPFLDAVKPEVAVLQAGVGNSYGHPHGVTLEKFNQRTIKVYATNFAGPITIYSDGKTYRVLTGKNATK